MTKVQNLLITALLAIVPAAAQTPAIVEGGVINGASFAKGQAVSPGSLVSIFGTDLASALAQADTVPLSAALDNVSVSFNGTKAPLYFVSSGQINAEVPWSALPDGANASDVPVIVTRNGASSNTLTVHVVQFSPGVFSFPPGAGYAIAINRDGSLAAPAGAISGIQTHPAKAGDVLEILATGLGAVTPSVDDGHDSLDHLRKTTTTPTVMIGGQAAQVQFSGLSPQFPGVYQLNVVVPNIPAGDKLPLQIQMGGSSVMTTDQVVISVSQ